MSFYTFFLHLALWTIATRAVLAAPNDCPGNGSWCGTVSTGACCPNLWTCNYRRGIPICQPPVVASLNGFGDDSCPSPVQNPYLFSCDAIGMSDDCCDVGSSCQKVTGNKAPVYCVNVLGSTSAAIPTSAVVAAEPAPSLLNISPDDGGVVFDPPTAWTSSQDASSVCGLSGSIYATNFINASVSFNYTNPSVMVRVITSVNGGAFSVFIDGFNTSYVVNTYSSDGQTCHIRQFPPMAIVPPGYETRTNHTISLIYIGYSPDAKGFPVTNSTLVQFESFALPQYSTVSSAACLKNCWLSQRFLILLVLSLVVYVS